MFLCDIINFFFLQQNDISNSLSKNPIATSFHALFFEIIENENNTRMLNYMPENDLLGGASVSSLGSPTRTDTGRVIPISNWDADGVEFAGENSEVVGENVQVSGQLFDQDRQPASPSNRPNTADNSFDGFDTHSLSRAGSPNKGKKTRSGSPNKISNIFIPMKIVI